MLENNREINSPIFTMKYRCGSEVVQVGQEERERRTCGQRKQHLFAIVIQKHTHTKKRFQHYRLWQHVYVPTHQFPEEEESFAQCSSCVSSPPQGRWQRVAAVSMYGGAETQTYQTPHQYYRKIFKDEKILFTANKPKKIA